MISDLKEQIAKEFLSDSNDFLLRYEILKERSLSGQKGLRSKLLVDLLFAAECSLKSLIFLLSIEDVNAIYKKICIHDLNKLLNKLPCEEKKYCCTLLGENFRKYKIENRYLLEVYKTFQSTGVLEEEYYNTLASPECFTNVYSSLKKLNKYILTKIKILYEESTFSEIDIEKLEKNHNERINLSRK